MNFGDILKQWEENKVKNNKNQSNKWLESYPPSRKDLRVKHNKSHKKQAITKRNIFRRMQPQRILDLHGLTVKQALKTTENFLLKCKKDNLKKILIIHGKGNHTKGTSLLKKMVREYIALSPLTGEYGSPSRKMGGSGATWVILR